MKKQFLSKAVPRGTRTIWRYLGALFILFTFAVGNVMAAESATNNPATVEYGTGSAKKTFLDVSNTVSNATISTGSVACVTYGLFEMDKNWKPAFYSGPANGSSSSFNYSGATSVGFMAGSSAGTGTAANKSATSGYGAAKYKSTAPATIYVTGITGIAVMGKDADTKNEKRLYIKVEEYAADGTCTPVGEGDGITKSSYNKSLHITTFDAGTLSGTKYYKVTLYAGYDTNHETSQIRFTKYIIPATKYSVTYKAGEGTGSDVVDSDAKTVKAFADCSFTAPSGYEFKEWQDGSSNVVEAGASVSDNMTLTAIYRLIPTKYTVEYILNGPSGDAPTETSKAKDDVFSLAAAPSWAGHAFDGWLCSADAAVKAAGSSYTMTAANTTFTAQWHELDCKIYSFTGSIGSAAVEAGDAAVNEGSLVMSGSSDIIKLTPVSGETFKAGDVVTISGTIGNTSKNYGIKISNAADKKATLGTASVAGTTNPLIATATLSANADYLYICRADGTTTTLLTCEVHRSCAEGAAAGLSYATAAVNKTEGEAKFTNALTNANGLILAGYKSSNAEVATVNFTTGEVTIVGPGSATITANSAVQTKAGTLYAAGSASYTLTVAALPKYHVTYNLNGGSGDVAEVDHKAGEKFNLHDGVTGITAPTNKTFVNWKDQDDALFDGGVEYTMPAKDVTLTAQWAGDVYTVKFMDGETVLDTKVVEVGSHPTDIEHPTKPLYTFAAWQLSGSDVILDDVSGAKDAVLTLTARWAKAYATSYDMEAYAVSDGASKAGLETALTAAGYAYTNINGIDNGHTHNYTYDGMKYKTNDGDLSFNVVAGKVVEVKTGHLPSDDAVTMYINGVADATVFEGADEEQETHKINYFYSAAEALYRLDVKASKGTCSVKKITIRDPYTVSYNPHGADAIDAQNATPSVTLPTPVNGTGNFKGWYDAETEGNKIGNAGASYTPTANITLHAQWEVVSTDNTLSDLQVDGATVAGFDPAVQIYNLVYEYGQQPVITSATATAGALATVTTNNTPVEEATFKYVQVKVVAESGAERFYQVRYTNNPKQGATIFKAELTSNTAADYSGMYADGDNSEIKLADDGANGYKFSGTSNYVKMAIADATFAEGDMLKMTYTTNPQQGELAIYDGTTKLQGTAYGNHILTFSDAADGKSTLFIRRTDDNNFNGWVAQVEVQRYMAPFIESFEIEGIGALDINPTTKAITATVPESFDVTALEPTIKAWANGSAHLDKSGAQDFTNPVTYTVTSDYAEDGEVTYTVTITKVAPSATPVIATQPAGANYVEGASVEALEVEATGAGTLSYQWQVKNGEEWENIDGATAASYTPAVSAIGSYTYRVVVTNTEESKPATSLNSNEATIVIAEDPSCKAIGYGTARDLAKNVEVVIDATTGLKHISSVSDYDTGKKISGESNLTTVKLGGSSAYYDIYTTEKNIGSIALSLTSSSNGEDKRYKYAVIFCKSATFAAADILGVVEQTGGAGDDEQVINTPEVPLGTKLVRIMRQYTYGETTYGQGNSSYIYYIRACLVEPAQEVVATVTAEPAGATYCPSDAVAALNYALSIEEGASAAYQWYKGTEAIEGATDATYTPSETGVYSCKAVVTKTGRLNKKLTSAEATVNFYEATEITGFENAAAPLNTEKTLSVTAAGTGTLTYKWQACTEAGVVTDENVLSSAATYGVTITEEPQYYLVTVEGECGSATQVLFAKKWADLELVDVDGSMTWNFAASNTGITDDVAVPSTMVLANVGQGAMPNTDNFRSDMLKAIVGTTQTKVRKSTDNGCYQGDGIMFHTTVPGIVTVTYRGTGNSADVTLTVGAKIFDTYHGAFTTCDKVFVPAGDVEISSVGAMRIQKIVFNAEPDYPRPVTEGRYGTICLPNGGVMTGATLYEIAYYEASSMKIFFDEIINGTMEAGVPYIYLPNEGAEQLGVFYTDAASADAGHYNGLYGSYTKELLAQNGDNYILKNNQYYVVNSDLVYVGENHAYIKISEVPNYASAPAPGRRRISMDVHQEEIATGFENLEMSEKPVKLMINGQIFILRGEKMYDATGRLVK